MNGIKRISCVIAAAAAAMFFSTSAKAQLTDAPDAAVADIPVNYTEANVGKFVLPDVLKLADGREVTDAKTWMEQRRPELLKYYQNEIYGRIPETAPKVIWEVVSTDPKALGGAAIMKKLAGHMGSADGPAIGVTLYTPANSTKPVPILVSISFNFAPLAPPRGGRAATGPATGPTGRAARGTAPTTGPAGRAARGPASGPAVAPRGTPAELISNGFGYATIVYNSIETDTSAAPNVNLVRKLALAPGKTDVAPDEWGTISAWAWGISRVVDYLESDASVDAKRVAIMGVSRLGKTVLWEGANDPRIALVIASCSGEGGAALARRNYGETIAHLVAPSRYPYQFAGNYAKYAKDPNLLAVDTHMLVALVAPRPLLLQTGNTDRWSDPKGEFLAAIAATPVFKLLGTQGIDTNEMPLAGKFVGNELGYYMHDGGHGQVPTDWDTYLVFMKKYLHPGT